MTSIAEINEIFEKITDRYDTPVPIGGRCESYFYYRTEELSDEDLGKCAEYIVNRIDNVLSPQVPDVILKLPGGYSFFAEHLTKAFQDILFLDIPLEIYNEKKISNGTGEKYKGSNAILITDVITTARSSLEAHNKTTLQGINVLCWATLIDRTFGPGPVPVVSGFTGEPVRVRTQFG